MKINNLKINNLHYRETEREKAAILFKGKCISDDKKQNFYLKNWKQNLWEKIETDTISYFKENNIDWHIFARQGHLLSSQVCCINHLFPIRHDHDNVLNLAKAVCKDFTDVLPLPTDDYSPAFIQFESVSDIDHLNEGKPTRGTVCTSIDALIYAVHNDGKKYLIPIEWKYTETYDNLDKSTEDRPKEKKGNELRGKERLRRYSKLMDESINLKSLPVYRESIYYIEPFYQLMRQTLWAEQMIIKKDSERIKADDYIHVHIIPDENTELLNKNYKYSEKPLLDSWQSNLKNKEKYKIISPESFIRNIDTVKYQELINYLQTRYWEVKNV